MMGVGLSAEASELNFSVTTIKPEFQVDKNKTYFDLQLEKNQQDFIEVMLVNNTKEPVVVEASLNRATTNINGIVEYGESNFKEDSSLINNIEEYVTISEPEITLSPEESKRVKMTVKAPSEEFSGVMAGGLTFKEKADPTKEEELKGLAIKNEYAFVVGILLHGNTPQTDLESEVVMNQVEAGQVNYRNVISANLQNTQAKYVNEMTTKTTIQKVGSSEILYKDERTDLQMAPNSNFDYPISLNGKKMEAGNYLLKMSVTSADGDWEFEKEFDISAEDARKYNKQDVSIEKDYTWWYVGGAIAVILLLQLIVFVTLSIRKKRNKKKSKRKSKK